jgi:hypothetical protein
LARVIPRLPVREWPSDWPAIWRRKDWSLPAAWPGGGDTASHRGAITAKGKTILVFGTSADAIYPKENPRLSEQILALGGALISEFAIGTFAAPQNFPLATRS